MAGFVFFRDPQNAVDNGFHLQFSALGYLRGEAPQDVQLRQIDFPCWFVEFENPQDTDQNPGAGAGRSCVCQAGCIFAFSLASQ